MKKIAILLGVMLSLTSSMYAKNYALVVGVPSGFDPNSGIEIDMRLMEGFLGGYGYDIETLKNPRPNDLRKSLKKYQSLSPNDNFVFYYTGHGGQIPDKNGDEVDGWDEVLGLHEIPKGAPAQGDWSSLFLDDELYGLLSKIKSQKYVFFDSCHSATAFKNLSFSGTISKSMGRMKGAKIEASQSYRDAEAQANKSPSLVFFGAAQDNEKALATSIGSMFTVSITDALQEKMADKNEDGKVTFKELEVYTKDSVRSLCEGSGGTIFSPELHVEGTKKSVDAIKALKGSKSIATSQSASSTSSRSDLEKVLDKLLKEGKVDHLEVSAKSKYKENERIELSIDSKDYRGYLYVILTDTKEHTVLYPNKYEKQSQRQGGKFIFPESVGKDFIVSAAPPYGRTVIFTILSDEPLDIKSNGSKGLFNFFDLRGQQATKTLSLMRGAVIKSNKIMIGKTVFDVKR